MTANYKMVKAVLQEIQGAMERLISTGETYTIYVASTGLGEAEQMELLTALGQGDIQIHYTETDQPVEWYETSFHGVWVGTFKNIRDEASVVTIEVCYYPSVAGSYKEDIQEGIESMGQWISAADL